MEPDIRDRIEGAVLGMAVGDALGASIDKAKPGALKNACRRVTTYVDPEKVFGRQKLFKWRKPGLYSVHTQQALVVLDSLLQDRGFRPEKVAGRMAELAKGAEFRTGVYRGCSRGLALTLTQLRQGANWDMAGRNSPSNEAAVRAVPIALYYRENEDEMVDAAARAALITHRNIIAVAAACAVALLVRGMMREEDAFMAGGAAAMTALAADCRKHEEIVTERYAHVFLEGYEDSRGLFSDALEGVAERFDSPADRVGKWIAQHADPHASNTVKRPTLDIALASVVYAIYLSILKTDGYESAVLEVVNAGGETAAMGAITGAVAGARHGAAALPPGLEESLANRKQIKVRAEALAARKWKKSRIEDIYEMEYGLSKRELDEKLARMRKAGVEFPEKKKSQKMSEPRPIDEKFDAKKFRREKRRLKKWSQFIPPDMLDQEDL